MSLGHWWIIAIILLIVLVIWGPGKLPDVGAGLGRAIREFRSAQNEVKESVSATHSPSSTTPPPNPVSGAPTVGEEAAASSTADDKKSS
jgi:sec-independent protein translocase protein TatA